MLSDKAARKAAKKAAKHGHHPPGQYPPGHNPQGETLAAEPSQIEHGKINRMATIMKWVPSLDENKRALLKSCGIKSLFA